MPFANPRTLPMGRLRASGSPGYTKVYVTIRGGGVGRTVEADVVKTMFSQRRQGLVIDKVGSVRGNGVGRIPPDVFPREKSALVVVFGWGAAVLSQGE